MDSSTPLSLPTEQSDLLRLLAYVYLQHGKAGPATVLFQAIHVLDPHDAGITRSLACALLRSGQPAEALALLDTLAVHGDTSSLTALLRGQGLARLGMAEQAAHAMQLFVQRRTGERARQGG